MRIEVWADVLAPETLTAKARLDAVLADREDDVEATWRPHPVDTTDAQRLIHLAYTDGGAALQSDVLDALLHARYSEGADVTDVDVLGEIASSAGFPQGRSMLRGDAGKTGVEEARLRAKAMGVRAIPTVTQADRVLEDVAGGLVEFLDGAVEEAAVPEETQRLRHAEALLRDGDPLGALLLVEPVMRDHPRNPDVMELAARAYFKSAQLRKALLLAERMVEANPADFYARRLLGRTLERMGRGDEARAHLRLVERISDE
jgi:tetratricopeptide (TPR) repeat protein